MLLLMLHRTKKESPTLLLKSTVFTGSEPGKRGFCVPESLLGHMRCNRRRTLGICRF